MPHLRPEELRERFAEADRAALADELIRGARPAVAIGRETTDDDRIRPGGSKLGGWPDLPQNFEWPRHAGKPLAFLAQFDLSEVPRLNDGAALPRRGLLSFFYLSADQPWGFDPADRGKAVVLHWSEPGTLVRRQPPPGAYADDKEYDEPFKACAARFEVVTTYPDMGNEVYEEDDDSFIELYMETIRAGQGEDEPRHQLLGLPLVIQNPMEDECQLVSNGIYLGDDNISRKDRARAEALRAGAQDWTLLLQLDSDDAAEWMWGDVGILYFWIRKQDLAAGDFANVWCILQCS